jgi:uncharacterized protein (DUF885 family)
MFQDLHGLFKEDWEWEMNDNPEFASQAGLRTATSGHCLQDVSEAGYQARKAHSAEMLKKMAVVDFTMFSSADARVYAPLFVQMHRDIVENIEHCPVYLFPINSMGYGGVCYSFLESIEWMPFDTLEDYDRLLARLKSAPVQMQQFTSAMRIGMEKKIVASTAMLRGVEAQLEEIIAGDFPEIRAPLKRPVAAGLSAEKLTEFEAAIKSVRFAFECFLNFFHDEYLPCATFDPSVSSLPGGERIYEQCLRYHTSTDMSPEEIHAQGVAEVARIEQRYVDDVLLPLGYKAEEFNKFVEFVRSDPQFYVGSSAELLQRYKEMCAKISKILPDYFNEIPKSPLDIVEKSVGPAAYYLAGTADGSRPGKFSVNCSDIEKRPLYEVVALSLHEANPGHHHQCSVVLESASLPDFMRLFEDRRYEVGGARRSMQTAYIEGWGLYCEHLGEEMGLYTTPYELFGRLSMEMMRAVRLVVDTGLHHQGWSVDRAIEYMMQKTGMHRHEVEVEIYRYATWPGQATAYKVGELAIKKYRRMAECELGSKFNIKDFHTAVLQFGPVPLHLLQNLVMHYINAVGPEADDAAVDEDDETAGLDPSGCPILDRTPKIYGDPKGNVSAYPQASKQAAAECPFKHGKLPPAPPTEADKCPHAHTGDVTACPVASKAAEVGKCPFTGK